MQIFHLHSLQQVDLMTMALIDSAFDKEDSVRKSISNALFELGRKQCELVLRYVRSLLSMTELTIPSRTIILQGWVSDVRPSVRPPCAPHRPTSGARRRLIGKEIQLSIQRCYPQLNTTSGSAPKLLRNRNTIICIKWKS